MIFVCNNKGCGETTEAKLNVDTDEVICEKCGQPITNISASMKRALKTCGQIVRNTTKRAFSMDCPTCRAHREVILEESTNKAVCRVCGTEIKVHPAMKQAMMETKKI